MALVKSGVAIVRVMQGNNPFLPRPIRGVIVGLRPWPCVWSGMMTEEKPRRG